MKDFNRVEARLLDADPRRVLKIRNLKANTENECYFLVLNDSGYLLFGGLCFMEFAIQGLPNPYGGTELVIPVAGLAWFIDVIENKFGKSEAEGGLKADDYAYEEIIEGERLLVARMFGIPGYAFRNYSRQSYIFSTEHPQEMGLSDELLFTGGGLQALKDLADKIASGRV